MNIAISASSPQIDGGFDPRFGRCPYFILVDADSQEWQALKNPGFHSSGGAGTSAAQFIVRHGAHIAISERFGPHAYTALEAANIQMYQAADGSVESVLSKYLSHELEPVEARGQRAHPRRGSRRHRR